MARFWVTRQLMFQNITCLIKKYLIHHEDPPGGDDSWEEIEWSIRTPEGLSWRHAMLIGVMQPRLRPRLGVYSRTTDKWWQNRSTLTPTGVFVVILSKIMLGKFMRTRGDPLVHGVNHQLHEPLPGWVSNINWKRCFSGLLPDHDKLEMKL